MSQARAQRRDLRRRKRGARAAAGQGVEELARPGLLGEGERLERGALRFRSVGHQATFGQKVDGGGVDRALIRKQATAQR